MLQVKKYTVNVHTGDVSGAGTDANVFITIFGDKGDTGERELHKSETHSNKFERNQIDRFIMEAADLGNLFKICIRHDNSMISPDWYLDYVEVIDTTNNQSYMFHCERWLARYKDDGKIKRTLYVKGYDGEMSSMGTLRSTARGPVLSLDSVKSSDPFSKSPRLSRKSMSITMENIPEGPMIAYEMTVYTGDVQDAGTDTKITVTLFGAKGTASPVVLEKAGDRFERDRADLIMLELEDVAPVKKMRVETDGKGSRPDWFLDKIELRNMDTGTLSVFECGEWLSKNKKDGKLVRDLPCKEKGKLVIGKASYKISVKTSYVKAAGTNANVYIILFGANGDSGKLHLRKSETYRDPFEKNHIDVFTFHDMLSLGELAKCRVWHDNTGIGAAWHLNYIEVEDLGTKKTFHFPCNRWLSKHDDDQQTLRELTCRSNIQSSSTNLHDENSIEQGAVMPTQEGTCKNLRVQDKTQASPKDQAGNMKAEIDQTEAVFVYDQLVQSAKSVGIIRSPGTCGTGFRVGPCYIMTAKHVVDQILRGSPVPLQPKMQYHPCHQLSNIDVFIDFSYERDGLPSDENLRFHFEPEIVYANEYLDTVILKLEFDTKEYPPPLTNFHDIAQLPQDRSLGYFIGHSRAGIKKTDKYHFANLTPDTVTAAKEWSMNMVNVDGYVGIDDPYRVLFHCSFERGASGSPGLWICPRDGKAYVELMLLRGYPAWYYDDKYKGNTTVIPNSYLVEQGVSMKSIYDDMKNIHESLCKVIFSSGDGDEEMKP